MYLGLFKWANRHCASELGEGLWWHGSGSSAWSITLSRVCRTRSEDSWKPAASTKDGDNPPEHTCGLSALEARTQHYNSLLLLYIEHFVCKYTYPFLYSYLSIYFTHPHCQHSALNLSSFLIYSSAPADFMNSYEIVMQGLEIIHKITVSEFSFCLFPVKFKWNKTRYNLFSVKKNKLTNTHTHTQNTQKTTTTEKHEDKICFPEWISKPKGLEFIW